MEFFQNQHPINKTIVQQKIKVMYKLFSMCLIAVILWAFAANASTVNISGTVSNEINQPLSGVMVKIKGKTNVTYTGKEGKYNIQVNPEDTYLIFSLAGYQTREEKILGRTIINIKMKAETIIMDEVELREESRAKKIDITAQSAPLYYIKSTSLAGTISQDYASLPFNTEGYSTIHENGYKAANINPLSTFSIDVDAASYSNVRRFLNLGQKPPVDAVRIEEMINYFNYDYPQPKGDVPFSINFELSECPWNPENKLLHIGLQGKNIPVEDLPPSNIVFLIDVSGSMQSPQKLPLLKSAFHLLVNQLREQDKVAIVVYAGSSGLVLPSTAGSNKETIINALNKLEAGGSTAGGEGLKLAYQVAADNFMQNGNNRIILATDGDFNIGPSSNAEMERLIEKEREKGINISVLGFGMGNYKDDKMEIIADKGNGNYAYIDNIQEAKKVLVSEFGGTLFTIAKDVKFQLEFNPAKVAEYRLIGYENRLLNEEDFENDKIDAGELGSGHTVTALYEIITKDGDLSNKQLKYQTLELSEIAKKSNELVTLKLRYKKPDGFKSLLIEEIVYDKNIPAGQTSDNFRFSASIAQFGMLLRDSEFKGNSSYDKVLSLANAAKGNDKEGYRQEFIKLVQTAKYLK